MKQIVLACAVLCAVVRPLPSAAVETAQVRHLVYAFTFDVRQTGEVTNDPGTPGLALDAPGPGGLGADGTGSKSSQTTYADGNGQTYSGHQGDAGTISVELVREQPDNGRVVNVSEQGRYGRNAAAATCVVYSNTYVICDPNAKVNAEEYTLLRFLGKSFVDPNTIDAKNHWQIADDVPAIKIQADYTIASNDKGLMNIGETRSVDQRDVGTLKSAIQSSIVYDYNRLVPIRINEYDTQRQYGGSSGTSTSTYETTLTLVSDSATKP
ncbi:MAG: hypothetical protein JOZ77_09615 [Candidatus Eremiobacteraeota bacterium]|nr:hypothetical protein [Candidatus Eremiobacteraeota bacterium]